MKVEFIITVEGAGPFPDSDDCDEIADAMERLLEGLPLPGVAAASTDSRWRKTL